MKHLKITRLIATLGATAGAAAAVATAVAAAPSRTAGAATSSAAEARATERALLRAAVAADIPTSRALLAPEFQQIDVTGSTATRAGYLAAIGGAIDFVMLKPLAPIRVRVYGNTPQSPGRTWRSRSMPGRQCSNTADGRPTSSSGVRATGRSSGPRAPQHPTTKRF